jgi:hypothetical protein
MERPEKFDFRQISIDSANLPKDVDNPIYALIYSGGVVMVMDR